MTDNKKDPGTLLGRTSRLAGKIVLKRFQEEKIHLTLEQFGLLKQLNEDEHLIQQELADTFKKHKSAVLRLIDVLEQGGLVTRSCDETDRRRKMLEVTAKGRALIERAVNISNEVISALQEGLSAQEIEVFEKVSLHMQEKALKQITQQD
jgi:DNA-binding MarR family transcriptional regulator